ncbi:HAD family acid phosphatase [Candidatus Lariskella endosymbiont of Epinotia ramella]|uniref:HAD family acid phosphatase n=1 Tax=Candidatus Lariskella endosymbiont of Epinotia ramella TaxID=3066224 RepID=UPI0030D3FC01
MNKKILSIITILICVASLHCNAFATQATSNTGNLCFDGCNAALLWYRTSSEMRAVHHQIYHFATMLIKQKVTDEGLKPGTWGIVADLDATILDTSWLELKRHIGGKKSRSTPTELMDALRSDKTETTVVPGALSFLKEVEKLGGYISFVTNRDTSVKIRTKYALKRLNIPYNQVMFYRKDNNKTKEETGKPRHAKTKEDRFFAIANGVIPYTLPQHDILMFIGDSIIDFPGMAKEIESDNFNAKVWDSQMHDKFSKFGTEFIILPNPTYGAWMKNCESTPNINNSTNSK